MSITHNLCFVIPQRKILINLATSKPDYIRLCKRINKNYAEDIFQEVCEQILTMPVARLPEVSYFNFWFYRVAFNIMSNRGKLGSVVCNGYEVEESVKLEDTSYEGRNNHDFHKHKSDRIPVPQEADFSGVDLLKEAEEFMLSLPEFENRIILLYAKLGDMKKVQRETGISYSALRYVKEKMKKVRAA